MSNSKNAILEIKNLMKKFGFYNEIKNGMFMDAKLKDGTEIKIEGESAEEGAKILVVTEEGEIPAPDGTHELANGVKVETKEGIITKIDMSETEEEEEKMKYEEKMKEKDKMREKEKMEEVAVDVPEEVSDVMSPEVIEAVIEALTPIVEELQTLAEEMKKMRDKMNKLDGDFQSFKKEPATKKIASGKSESFGKLSNIDDRIKTILSMREN